MGLRIAVVDSGCAPVQAPQVQAAAAFELGDIGVRQVPASADTLGHGGRVAEILLHCAPQAELLVAQVFRERLTTTAALPRGAWAIGLRRVRWLRCSGGPDNTSMRVPKLSGDGHSTTRRPLVYDVAMTSICSCATTIGSANGPSSTRTCTRERNSPGSGMG